MGRGSAIRVNSVKCFSPSLSLSPPLCGVTRITCFSPNGHFYWQVHYTPYFQIVFPLLMPGRLIARVWLAEKGLRCVRAPDWKTLITVFLRAWLRPLKGKILTFSPLSLLSMGPARQDGPCHQNDSINSSERTHTTPSSLLLCLFKPGPSWESRGHVSDVKSDRWHYHFDYCRKERFHSLLRQVFLVMQKAAISMDKPHFDYRIWLFVGKLKE